MSKALVIIKSMGIGDLCILISSIHAISKKIDKSVKVLAQKNTHAAANLEHDPHVDEVIELNEKEINTVFLKPKYGDASGVRGAAWLGRKLLY